MKLTAITFATLIAVFALAGCTETQQDTLGGAALGAGAGALIGSGSGNAGTGAAIGAGVGAVGGAMYGESKGD